MRARRSRFAFLFAGLLFAPLTLPCGAQQTAVDLKGSPIDPLKSSAGKVVVLVFARTDCPISNRYAPTIQELSARYRRDAIFWLVYPDKTESAEKIREHQKEFGYTLAAVRDPHHALVRRSRVRMTPEAAVYARDGQLIYHGRIDDRFPEIGKARPAPTTHELDEAVQAAIAGRRFTPASTEAVGCFIADLE